MSDRVQGGPGDERDGSARYVPRPRREPPRSVFADQAERLRTTPSERLRRADERPGERGLRARLYHAGPTDRAFGQRSFWTSELHHALGYTKPGFPFGGPVVYMADVTYNGGQFYDLRHDPAGTLWRDFQIELWRADEPGVQIYERMLELAPLGCVLFSLGTHTCL